LEPEAGHIADAIMGDRMVASRQSVADEVRKLQNAGKKVVFTNGCFDILHAGHIDLLRRARALGDALVVAINSDSSVGRMKGSSRPVVPEQERAELLEGMEMVDFVCTFDEDTPLEAILCVRPDVIVKSADWTGNIVGQSEVEGWGGKVESVRLVEGRSTTRIIEQVVLKYGASGKKNS